MAQKTEERKNADRTVAVGSYPKASVRIDRVFYRFVCPYCLFENVECSTRDPKGSLSKCHVCNSAVWLR